MRRNIYGLGSSMESEKVQGGERMRLHNGLDQIRKAREMTSKVLREGKSPLQLKFVKGKILERFTKRKISHVEAINVGKTREN